MPEIQIKLTVNITNVAFMHNSIKMLDDVFLATFTLAIR